MMFKASIARGLAYLFLLIVPIIGSAAPDLICPPRMTMTANGNDYSIAYCANVDVDSVTLNTERILIVVHGSSRNAEDYFDYAEQAGILADDSDITTAIVAPYFLTESDLDAFNLAEDMLFWSSGGWKKGNTSNSSTAHPRDDHISSFAVLDELLQRLIDNNPNATQAVIVGHSAGGQFVNRYAAGGQTELANPGLPVRYVSANPSSWLYFSPERVEAGSVDVFSVPDSASCPDYDDYKYGLLDMNNYMNGVGVNALRQNYQQRNVIYLLGELDDNPNDSSMDTTCPADKQGPHRLLRSEIYFNYVNWYFGTANLGDHQRQTVLGVGHSGSNMLQSPCGQYYLFDHPASAGNCAPTNGATAPAAPTGLTATVTTTGKGKDKQKTVTLNWSDNASNEDEYIVERCLKTKGKNSSCVYAEIATVAADNSQYVDQPGGDQFRYRVKARNAYGDSAYSNEVTI